MEPSADASSDADVVHALLSESTPWCWRKFFVSALSPASRTPASYGKPGSDGKTNNLADYRGLEPVVTARFRSATTRARTREGDLPRAGAKGIRKSGVAFLEAGVDTEDRNREAADMLELEHSILSDPWKRVARAYAALAGGRRTAARRTFSSGIDG